MTHRRYKSYLRNSFSVKAGLYLSTDAVTAALGSNLLPECIGSAAGEMLVLLPLAAYAHIMQHHPAPIDVTQATSTLPCSN